MARPKPTILVEHVDPKTYKSEQILEAEAVFAVFYKGEPINIRSQSALIDYAPKYKKSTFVNPGHALNLAERLNEMFKCTDFTVHKLIAGEKYTGEEY
ncbi:hypothetical protein RVBP17_2410 [Pseudomonas phage sp. 30-3]|uniref:Uncharacterized protein n=1 Tax=Pseudomonas phage vB_PaeM_PA5oct TaxID=2163605 RepID=A0A4Y1LUY8_9CAUD|nr:hypothetical protein PQE65_gp154 [Pseudomonas phage vB_PaeM_PA5oct]WMI31875.1 hypothetical protein GBBBJNDB_00172 [Pseudomonas phage Callisto]WPK38805.1 hypothetical protein Cassandra_0129 [Pseudomonas phage Cassandra]WPK39326.1 hypothetical protein Deiofobo_0129 [Pseudomonas phage Deifobo]WPK39838.1 hypothetical protein ETTORE_0129 [Pseudomonas phage Ettore]WPK40359.1 hypothetical protein Paride_0129 [Pseudomonas phage Paride]VOH54616.1 hypothetical protein MIJ3_00172 [Pseudomonas phage v